MDRKIDKQLYCCPNGSLFYKWNDLTLEEKNKNILLTNTAFRWCEEHPGQLLTFETLNKNGLNHVYRFKLDDYNFTHQWTQIKVENDGLRLISTK